MAMQTTTDAIAALAHEDDDEQLAVSTVVELARNETMAQLDAAHRYKRSVSRFLKEATSLATISQEIAEACIYSMPRGGKMITGPSVRLAEICASAYGNLQIGARVVDEEDAKVVAQGVAWDMEKNLRCTIEIKRRITNKYGKRYDDDMITVTGNAAASIALRNAIFRVIPKAYVHGVYESARSVAVGDAKTLADRREQILARFEKLGVPRERVLLRLEKRGVEDIGLEDLELLIGLGTAIKNNDTTIDEAFPVAAPAPAAPEQDGKRIKMTKKPTEPADPEPGSSG